MQYVLTILISFYPTIFLYASIPQAWMKWIDDIIPAGNGSFFVHLAVFALIFFFIYRVFAKFVMHGYYATFPRGIFSNLLYCFFALLLAVIVFYNVLPGDILYDAPKLLDNYLLKNPYTFIAFIAPIAYLFFD